MNTRLLDLDQLSARLKREDNMIIALIKRRMDLAKQVGAFKRQTGKKMFRPEIETQRIEEMKGLAIKLGLDPNFAAALMYQLIGESCKVQAIEAQEESENISKPATDDEWYGELKKNLLVLTERWCDSYDEKYENGFAIKVYLDFERALIEREIGQLESRGTLLDLGCATGKLTFPLSEHFKQAVGFDSSPHMVSTAQKKIGLHPNGGKVSFCEIDVEDGIPVFDAAASFVVMSLGTGSDVPNIRGVISETMRVLEPGGRFLFSFYNRDALLYHWEFLPWAVGLTASIDLARNCLEVTSYDKARSQDEKLPVYARAYMVAEVEEFFREVGATINLSTYPTVSSILPEALFSNQPDVQKAMMEIDETLSVSTKGAYIIVTGHK